MSLLFLAGLGRSGTTLLERCLGETPGVTELGETVHLWERGLLLDERCGCGAAFSRCPWWTAVGDAAYGGWANVDAQRMVHLQRRVDRISRVPAVLAGRSALHEAAEYAEAYQRLYAAARDLSGGDVLVDSSKQVSLAWLLHLAGTDLALVHCVRDSRGVAASWARETARPEAAGDAVMPRYSAPTVSAKWLWHNAGAEALARRVPALRWRYEDFVADPSGSLRAVLALAGLGGAPLDHVGHSVVRLGTTHSVAGNPMRFQHGDVVVRADERWRTELAAPARRTVTALTAPLLARYGYLR